VIQLGFGYGALILAQADIHGWLHEKHVADEGILAVVGIVAAVIVNTDPG
jgi:hypothetical protein